MENFTIHIFGYGETQINSKDLSIKVRTLDLTKVQPLIDAIWVKKPQDSQAEQSFHVIHLFGYDDIRYGSKNGFDLKKETDLKPLIVELIDELKIKYDALPKTDFNRNRLLNTQVESNETTNSEVEPSATTNATVEQSATTNATVEPSETTNATVEPSATTNADVETNTAPSAE